MCIPGSDEWDIERHLKPMESLDEVVKRLCSMEAPLNERLASFAAYEREQDPLCADAYDELTRRLISAKAGSSSPDAGDIMPAFALPDAKGLIHRLDKMLVKGPVVVSFNRGHWCPYCLVELNALKQGLKRIAETGAQVVSIMPDAPEYITKISAEIGDSFIVLSDRDNGYALALDLVLWLGDRLKTLFIKDKLILDDIQHNGAWFVPIPATFVVGTDGRIIARLVDPDFRKRMEIDDIIAALKRAWT
jgi:peroxiredoxin